MVPPLAELKALRGLQETIQGLTREVSDLRQREGRDWRNRLMELGARQEAVAELGMQLMRKMNQLTQELLNADP